MRRGEEDSFRSSWEVSLKSLATVVVPLSSSSPFFFSSLSSFCRERGALGSQAQGRFSRFSCGVVPPPISSQLASCCFFLSSFSFSLTGSGTGMSKGALRLLRLASLRAGSWCRVGGGLEARASLSPPHSHGPPDSPLGSSYSSSLPSPSTFKNASNSEIFLGK